MLARAELGGADPRAVRGVRLLLDSAGHRVDRLYAVRQRLPRLVPAMFRSPRWVPVLGWLLVVSAAVGIAVGILQLALGGLELDTADTTLDIGRMGIAEAILFTSACLTFLVAAPAIVRYRPDGPLWPLHALRIAALIFTVLAMLSYRIGVRLGGQVVPGSGQGEPEPEAGREQEHGDHPHGAGGVGVAHDGASRVRRR
ncbi:Uncharacterised protein [Mycobacteroides abscessus subsp. abscessus]|nr:Uncharacterised protein [Mycobacteroides abscessus subsp. abscessus]